ncbi:E3 ubiquitin-protein ligase RNF180 isoform X2 [Kryptolebias marmoratus]|uniref:E3 ubiquitin-protein ligase RNF180 isoform X2 n=1 Tax=Kryptolebias marmoratus TaxID=37003 RepID=UPI000D52FBC3|nr:E3 ubiquitin-protein ligase RNF180 isoform X2 [Kryptolebias marmoratus]
MFSCFSSSLRLQTPRMSSEPAARRMAGTLLRCRRCRKAVFDLTCLSSARWTAGKLSCCHCGARLGGFNFLSRCECPCGRDATVHLKKSRVDLDHERRVPIVRPRRTRSGAGMGTGLSPGISRPAESPDRVPDGGTHQRRCCLEDDGSSADSTDLLRTQDTESPTDPGVPGVRRLSQDLDQDQDLDLDLDQTDEAESTSVLEEVSGSAPLRRRFSSDGEALLREERVSSEPEVSVSSSAAIRPNRREKNRLKSRRRKERRRQRWLQAADGSPLDLEVEDRDGLTCPVCLDVYFSPYACRPCGHVFCEPCLRTLAQNRPTDTPCPLCRALVSNAVFSRELDQTVKTLFPNVYGSRKQNFQNASCARWPLPNSKKPSRPFWENRRSGATAWRRWRLVHGGFPPAAAYLNDARGSQLNVGLVLIRGSSFYWILALKVACILLYCFVF